MPESCKAFSDSRRAMSITLIRCFPQLRREPGLREVSRTRTTAGTRWRQAATTASSLVSSSRPRSVPAIRIPLIVRQERSPTAIARAQAASRHVSSCLFRSPSTPWAARSRQSASTFSNWSTTRGQDVSDLGRGRSGPWERSNGRRTAGRSVSGHRVVGTAGFDVDARADRRGRPTGHEVGGSGSTISASRAAKTPIGAALPSERHGR